MQGILANISYISNMGQRHSSPQPKSSNTVQRHREQGEVRSASASPTTPLTSASSPRSAEMDRPLKHQKQVRFANKYRGECMSDGVAVNTLKFAVMRVENDEKEVQQHHNLIVSPLTAPHQGNQQYPSRVVVAHEPQDEPASVVENEHTEYYHFPRNTTATDKTKEKQEEKQPLETSDGSVSLADFEVLKMLGRGSHGKVFLVRYRGDGKLYAMKQMRKREVRDRNYVDNAMTELFVNMMLLEGDDDDEGQDGNDQDIEDHERNVPVSNSHTPFIAKLHWAFHTRSRLYLVTDYLAGGELFFHISKRGPLPESLAMVYGAQITHTLASLHRRGVLYSDLKPENLLLCSDGHINLVDFGLSRTGIFSPTHGSQSVSGTAEYMAPEVLCNAGYGTAADWWSLGMLLYEMLTGLPPWYCKERLGIMKGILHGKLSFPDHMSDDACTLIAGLLTRDPRYRLGSSFLGATEIMEHPFFAQIDWKSLADRELRPKFEPAQDIEGSNFDPAFTNAKLDVEQLPLPPRQDDEFTAFHFSRTDRLGVRARLRKLHIRTKPSKQEREARLREAKRALADMTQVVQVKSKQVNESSAEHEAKGHCKGLCRSHGAVVKVPLSHEATRKNASQHVVVAI